MQIFQHVAPGREAARALVGLRQGKRRVSDYAIEFRKLAAESGWNSSALFAAFLHGLSAPMKDHLVPLDLPTDLDALVALAIKINKQLQERVRERLEWSRFSCRPAEGFSVVRGVSGYSSLDARSSRT